MLKMKKLLSVFLSAVMLFCALSVFVRAEEPEMFPWRNYDNYLFYNNTNQEKKIGFVTDCIMVEISPTYLEECGDYIPAFLGLSYIVDSIVYDTDSGLFILYLKEDDFELDENGYPIYTEEWLDKVIDLINDFMNYAYVGYVSPNIGEILEQLKLDRTLSFGCKGDDVKLAQKYLCSYGYLTATPDGIYGAMSEAAVIMFQAYNGLANPDGKIGNWTLGKINADSAVYFSPMSKGSSGNSVKVMQTYLKKLGYLTATPDGIFGAKSEAALKRFQKDHGFEENGVADILTLSALFNRSTKNSSYYILTLTRTLKYGDRGTDVKKIQALLYDLGYLTAVPDGSYGPKTEAAVIAFQAFNGLATPDGKVGNWTLAKLNGEPVPFSVLKKGSSGNAVLVLQKYLLKLNYLKTMTHLSTGKVVYNDVKPDGKFGNFTDGAVKIFQYINGLCWDGIVSVDTYTAVVSRTAKPKPLDGKYYALPVLY